MQTHEQTEHTNRRVYYSHEKGKKAASKIYVKTRRETGAYSVLPEEMLK